MTEKSKNVDQPERRATPRLKKNDLESSSPDTKTEGGPTPAQPGKPASESPSTGTGPKRAVLKTIKRATASPPPSPTLRRVSDGLTRRVVPKAAPPKPVIVPPPPPAPEPPPVAAKPAAAPISPAPSAVPAAAKPPVPTPPPAATSKAPATPSPAVAAPSTPAKAAPASSGAVAGPSPAAPTAPPASRPAPSSAPTGKEPPRKEGGRVEPTVTYKMPAPAPLRTGRPLPPVVRPPATPAGASASAPSAARTDVRPAETPAAPRKKIRIPEVVTVKDLAERLGVKP